MGTFRRIVTGHSADGRSVIASDRTFGYDVARPRRPPLGRSHGPTDRSAVATPGSRLRACLSPRQQGGPYRERGSNDTAMGRDDRFRSVPRCASQRHRGGRLSLRRPCCRPSEFRPYRANCDPTTWTPSAPRCSMTGELNCVTFNPKGDLLLTASTDFTARIWHVATAKRIGPACRSMQDVSAVSCSPDGRIVGTISDDNTAGLWSMPVPVTDDPDQVWRWAQRISGHERWVEDDAFSRSLPEGTRRIGAGRQRVRSSGA